MGANALTKHFALGNTMAPLRVLQRVGRLWQAGCFCKLAVIPPACPAEPCRAHTASQKEGGDVDILPNSPRF
eukprot:m.457532 g.457532  ORF g.457532 m.457532 type:complete len:72 (-) comp204752_c0_seq1:76-291(-)